MTKKVQVHNINKFNKNAHNIMKQMKNFEKKINIFICETF